MSVIAGLSVPADEFPLGSVLSSPDDGECELHRVVSIPGGVAVIVWAADRDATALPDAVEGHDGVKDVALLTTVDGDGLYRVDWSAEEGDFLSLPVVNRVRILHGRDCGEEWVFRVCAPDRGHLIAVYNYCLDHGITGIRVRWSFRTDREADADREFSLTPNQREAITLAARRGYFSTPREVNLSEIADELGVSQQAVSQRIRRATEKIVLASLSLPPAGE